MRIVIIDSFALVHRVYHALPYFTDQSGAPAGAVYGFCSLVLKIYKDLRPDKILAAFDLPVPTFRQQLFPSYQAHRPEKKEDFAPQVEKIKEFLRIARVPVLASAGFEGDDVIGSLVKQLAKNQQDEIIILTGDNDTLQLTSAKVKVFTMKKGISDLVIYDAAAAEEKLGFAPQLLPDYKALAGDSSDGIPGVEGVGPKTATSLIQKFGSLEKLYEFLEKKQRGKIEKPLTDKLVQKLIKEKERAFLCKKLGTIRQDVELETRVLAGQPDFTSNELAEFFEQQGFYSLLKRLKLKSSAEPSLALSFNKKTASAALSLYAADWKQVRQEIVSRQSLYWLGLDAKEIFVSGEQSWCRLTTKKQFGELADLFSDDKIKKAGFQLKSLLKNFLHLELRPVNVWDLEILGWLLDPDSKKYELQQLAARYLGAKPVAPDELAPQAALELVRDLLPTLADKLKEENLERVYLEIELPLIPVLAHMENVGILLDAARLKVVQRELHKRTKGLEEKIFQFVGKQFNLNSSRELSAILYQDLKLSPGSGARIKKLKSGYYSTDAEQLGKISAQHPVVELILRWKELAKLKSTYTQALLERLDPKSDRIHAVFIQTGTATGRLASVSPNLQNIPKHSEEASLIRSAFRSAPGWSLLAFDYSQIELRLVASLSEDENLLRAFKENQDIHQVTASLVWGVPLQSVDQELRFRAKALNFGILYGMGARSLAQTAGISLAEARTFIAAYFNKFTAVKRYISGVLEFLKANGYVETLWGRRRYFPEYFSGSSHLVSQAERMALNLTLQGLAADIIKTAMVRIYYQLILPQADKLRLICQVHDELLFEVKDGIIEEIKGQIQSILEGVYQDKVSLVAHCHQGKYWSELD